VKALAHGLSPIAKRVKAFITNDYRFHSTDREIESKNQNFSIMVEVDGKTYYGRIIDVYVLDYYGHCEVVVFHCEWLDINSHEGLKQDANGFTCANFSKLIHAGQHLKNGPFIFCLK